MPSCHAAITAAIQNSPNTTFTKITLGFLVLCFYLLEFYKCFSLALLLAVPLIVYINLAEPIIRVTRYCLERHPPPGAATSDRAGIRLISALGSLISLRANISLISALFMYCKQVSKGGMKLVVAFCYCCFS